MKRLFYTLALGLFAFQATAQTLLDVHLPSIGDKMYLGNDTLRRPFSMGGAGGSQTWNFTVNQLTMDSIVAVDPNSTPNGAQFSTSNIAMQIGANYLYAKKSSAGLEEIGFYGDPGFGVEMALNYEPNPMMRIQTPSSVTSSFTDNVRVVMYFAGSDIGLPVDSVKIVHKVNRTSNIDASGTLTYLGTTFNGTLRQHLTDYTQDSITIKIDLGFGPMWVLPSAVGQPFDDVRDTTHTYNWYQPGVEKFPVFTIEYGAAQDTAESISFKYNQQSSRENKNGILSTVYPNPANNQTTISLQTNPGTVQIQLFNMVGQKMQAPFKQMDNQIEIQTKDLESGVYFYQIVSEGKAVSQGRFVVSH